MDLMVIVPILLLIPELALPRTAYAARGDLTQSQGMVFSDSLGIRHVTAIARNRSDMSSTSFRQFYGFDSRPVGTGRSWSESQKNHDSRRHDYYGSYRKQTRFVPKSRQNVAINSRPGSSCLACACRNTTRSCAVLPPRRIKWTSQIR